MSQINSPIKQSKDKLRFSSASYKNIRLHLALDEAKHYSNLVNSHFNRAKQENHVLTTAKSHYLQPLKSLTLTSKQFHPKKELKRISTSIQTKTINPQSRPLIDSLHSKAMRIPQFGQLFKSGIQDELELRRKIKELKHSITEENKRKDKIALNSAKLLNEDQKALAHIRQMERQSSIDQILIKQLIDQCNYLNRVNNKIREDTQNCISKAMNEKQQVNFMTKTVSQLKKHLSSEVNMLNELKYKQTVSYKAMVNDYNTMTLLKQEKALMLNRVDQNVCKNS